MDNKVCDYNALHKINFGFGNVKIPAVIIKNIILDRTKNVELKNPLIITLEVDEMFGTALLTNSDFNILIYTKEGVDVGVKKVIDYFNCLYENYVKCDINELSGDALELRRKLIKFVGERDNEVPFKYNNLKAILEFAPDGDEK